MAIVARKSLQALGQLSHIGKSRPLMRSLIVLLVALVLSSVVGGAWLVTQRGGEAFTDDAPPPTDATTTTTTTAPPPPTEAPPAPLPPPPPAPITINNTVNAPPPASSSYTASPTKVRVEEHVRYVDRPSYYYGGGYPYTVGVYDDRCAGGACSWPYVPAAPRWTWPWRGPLTDGSSGYDDGVRAQTSSVTSTTQTSSTVSSSSAGGGARASPPGPSPSPKPSWPVDLAVGVLLGAVVCVAATLLLRQR